MGQWSLASTQVSLVDTVVPGIRINPFVGLLNPASKLTIKGKHTFCGADIVHHFAICLKISSFLFVYIHI
jgi:hypothetical protein